MKSPVSMLAEDASVELRKIGKRNFRLACTALLTSALAFFAAVVLFAMQVTDDNARKAQAKDTRQNRVETVSLICDLNGAFVAFVKAPPDLARDAPTLRRLKMERCSDVLAGAKRLQRLPVR